MTSRLFHTVVGVGLSLGAMTMGCSAETAPETASTDVAQVTTTEGEPTLPTTAEPTTASTDRFCEVAWPTTKGGPRPSQAQACIDPQRECDQYPGTISPDLDYGGETCVRAADVNSCNFEKGEVWMFCKNTAYSHEWTCPSGTVKVSSCVWPENEKPTRPSEKAGE